MYFILYPIVYSLALYYWSVTLFFSRHFQITNLSIVKTKNIIIIIHKDKGEDEEAIVSSLLRYR